MDREPLMPTRQKPPASGSSPRSLFPCVGLLLLALTTLSWAGPASPPAEAFAVAAQTQPPEAKPADAKKADAKPADTKKADAHDHENDPNHDHAHDHPPGTDPHAPAPASTPRPDETPAGPVLAVQKYALAFDAEVTFFTNDGKSRRSRTQSTIQSTHTVHADRVDIAIDSLELKIARGDDDQPAQSSFLSADEVRITQGANPTKTFRSDTFTPAQKLITKRLGVPLATVFVDKRGGELLRRYRQSSGPLIEQEVLDTVLAFQLPHPEIPANTNPNSREPVPVRLAMGQGRIAEGAVTLTPKTAPKPNAAGDATQPIVMEVKGLLQAAPATARGAITVNSAEYTITGEQTYDPKLSAWTSGTWTIELPIVAKIQSQTLNARSRVTATLTKLP